MYSVVLVPVCSDVIQRVAQNKPVWVLWLRNYVYASYVEAGEPIPLSCTPRATEQI